MATTIEATAATALAPETLRQLEGTPLAEFLRRQRWFSGQHDAGTPRLTEIITLFPSCDAVLTQVDVGDASYFVPMALTDKPADPATLIATVRTRTATLSLIDAPYCPVFREALLKSVVDARRYTNNGTELRFTRYQPLDLDPVVVPSHVARAEQSNTSIVYSDLLILKLFRKLTVGENPDIELGTYLTRKGARFVPQLVGSATLEGDRGSRALIMAQRLVAGAEDLWSHVVGRIPELHHGGAPFVTEARDLGRITRELHETLGVATDQEGFTPRRAGHDDLLRWCNAIRRELADSIAAIERTDFSNVRQENPTIAQGLRDMASVNIVLRRVSAMEDSHDLDLGLTIRHHGDYHLGQVLRDATGGYAIIDFEGEPTRPLADRRALHSPLRDVASMLRSFAYAAAMAVAALSSGPQAVSWDIALTRATAWQEQLRGAFLEGYLATSSTTLPADRATCARLIDLFEIEKVFYELRYELTHRPDWVWVPMRNVSALIRDQMITDIKSDQDHSASAGSV